MKTVHREEKAVVCVMRRERRENKSYTSNDIKHTKKNTGEHERKTGG